MLSVNDLMNSQPLTVRPDDSLSQAAKTLWEGNCGGLPVVDDELKPVGFLTDRDIAMSGAIQGRALHELSVSSSMTGRCVTVPVNAAASRLHQLMREHRVRRLPVVDDSGVLVGVVSVSDLVSHEAARPRASRQAAELRRTLGALSHSVLEERSARTGSATGTKAAARAGRKTSARTAVKTGVKTAAKARVVKKAPSKARKSPGKASETRKKTPVRRSVKARGARA